MVREEMLKEGAGEDEEWSKSSIETLAILMEGLEGEVEEEAGTDEEEEEDDD